MGNGVSTPTHSHSESANSPRNFLKTIKSSISTTLEISTPKSPQFNVFNRLILSNSTMTLNPLSKTCQLDTECEIDYVEGVKLLTLENPPLTIGSVTKADTLSTNMGKV